MADRKEDDRSERERRDCEDRNNRREPRVDAWHAYRYPDATAEIVLVGMGFGASQGSVKLNIQGRGKVDSRVKLWTDTAIVVSAPADVKVVRAHITILAQRGSEKLEAQSPEGEYRLTTAPNATWTVSSTDDFLDHIEVVGTDLSDVRNIFLYDSMLPQHIYKASFYLNNGILEIDWPASFTAPITKMRLSDANGQHVSEVSGGPSGWVPAPNGIILNAVAESAGNGSIINIIGTGLGDSQGSVQLRQQGGSLQATNVISGSWTDSVVQVGALPGTTYDLIQLTRADGEVANISSSVPATITTPSNQPIISSAQGVSLGIHLEGSGFLNATSVVVYRGIAKKVYTAAEWFSANGAAWTDTVLEILYDSSADNLSPVTSVKVTTSTGESNILVGSWSMDNLGTVAPRYVVTYDHDNDILTIVSRDSMLGNTTNILYTLPGPDAGHTGGNLGASDIVQVSDSTIEIHDAIATLHGPGTIQYLGFQSDLCIAGVNNGACYYGGYPVVVVG